MNMGNLRGSNRVGNASFRLLQLCVLALLPGASVQAANLYWDGTGTSWAATSGWSTSPTATTPDPASVPVAADTAIFNITSVSSFQSVNLDGNQAVTALSFLPTATGGVTLLGGSGDSILSLGANGISMGTGAGPVIIGSSTAGQAVAIGITGGAVSFPNYQNWNNNSSNLLTINNGVSITAGGARTLGFGGTGTGGIQVNGAISNGASTLTLVINNANATHTLTGANTYTGTTTVTAGTLVLSGASGAIAGGAVSLSGNLVLDDRGVGAANGNRIGTGTITLGNKSSFSYLGSDQAATNSTETLGTLALGSGVSRITASYNGTNTATLTSSSITRTASSGGIALVNGVGLGRDGTSTTSVGRLIVTASLSTVGTTAGTSTGINSAVQNTRIVSFLLGEVAAGSGGLGTATGVANTFVTYNSATGLRPLNLDDEFTGNAIAAGNNTYITGNTTAASSTAINSLIINGGNLLIGDGATITDTSGALFFSGNGSILPSATTGAFSFGSAEGIVSLNSGVTGTIGASLDGSNGMTIYAAGTNPGTLVLDGANTYGGTTRIQSGVNVVIGNDGAFGTSVIAQAGGIIMGDGQPRTLANRLSISGSQIIGGSSDLTFGAPVSGPAVSRESNSNAMMVVTNTGTTTVSGQYSLYNSASGSYANNGAGVRFGSSANVVISGAITDNNSGNVPSGTGSDFDLIFTGAGANISIVPTSANNAFGLANVMMVTSSGHYNTITVGGPGGSGDTITPFGALGIASNSANLVAFFKADKDGQILNNTIQSQASVGSANGFGFVGSNNMTLGGNYSILASASFINLATGTWTFGSSASVGTSTFTLAGSGDTVFNSASSITGTTGSLAKLGSGTLTLAGTNSLTGSNSFSGGTVILDYSAANANRLSAGTTATALTLAGADLQLKGGSYSQALGTGGGTTINGGASKISQTSSGTSTIALGVITRAASNAGTIDFASNGIATTTSGNTSGILGTGWATVGGTNWATVSGGAIQALTSYDSFASPGTNSNVLLTGSDFVLNGTVINTLKINTSATAQSLTLEGTLTLNNNGLLFVGANDYSITGGTLRRNNSGSSDLIIHQNGAGILTVDSVIGNGGTTSGLTKTGTGTLELNGTNTYAGITSVIGGVLKVNSNSNLGTTGAVTLSGGTLQVATAFDTSRAMVLGANGGTLQVDSGTMDWSGVVTGNSYGALNKTGTGTLILSGNNTYGGATNINAGTLQLGSATGLGASSTASNRSNSPVNVNGGTLDINGYNAAVGNFYLNSGSLTDTAGTGSLAAYSFNLKSGTVGAVLTDLVISGSAGNAANLYKTTAGVATITGANTYTGNTVVSAGTLLVNGSLAAGSAVQVGAATLGGSGTVAGLVTTAGTTSRISPGNSPGTLTLSGGLNAAAGATLVFELGTSSDLLALGSGVFTGSTAANGLLFEFSNSGGLVAGSAYTLATFGSSSGLDYSDLLASIVPSGFVLDSSFGTNGFLINSSNLQVQFSAVPEPTTYALLGLGLGALAWLRRRKNA